MLYEVITESKGTAVAIARYAPAWHGFAASTKKMRPDAAYWALAQATGGWRAELADSEAPGDWEVYVRELFDAPDAQAVTVLDSSGGGARVALIEDGKVIRITSYNVCYTKLLRGAPRLLRLSRTAAELPRGV